MERPVHLAVAAVCLVVSTVAMAANTRVVRVISAQPSPDVGVPSARASTAGPRIITAETRSLVYTISAADEAPSKLSTTATNQSEHLAGADGQTQNAVVSPSARVIAAPVVSWCPEGTYLSAPPQSEIRLVAQSQDEVISAPVPRSCVLKVPPAETFPAYLVAAQRVSPPKARRARPEEDAQTRRCVFQAARALGINSTPLFLILDVEGGALGQVSRNTNGTYDIGPAQINSSWLPTLAKQGISEDRLTNDLCINILASAWIYSKARRRTDSVAEAIAQYHSPTPGYQKRYLRRIDEALERRLADLGSNR